MDLIILDQKKTDLQEEVDHYHAKLQEEVANQKEITNIEELAQSILDYTNIENEISDRGLILTLLSQSVEHFKSPYFKAQFGLYLDAAETCSPEIVNFITDIFHEEIRTEFPTYQFPDEFHTEYRDHIIPGKILAGHFDEIDGLVREMIDNVRQIEPKYDESMATQQLYEAFKVALDMHIRLDAIKVALEEGRIAFLTEEARKDLLELLEEKKKAQQFEESKDQNVAMERAVKMLEQREVEK
ncbi:hypothetical protein KKC88_06045 [Patescibacteria group bacterium]|nr:hypothetical protein [Patescibacteria group bacterium]MBU1673955.1 hypothetical protein [Patescibacteria group bacterium]MBU1963949.1 hypothetical protein [Patescibacteria group bacterium]